MLTKTAMLASVSRACYTNEMKLFVILGILAGGYYYAMTHTTDMVLQQVEHINQTYQYVGEHADQIAAGRQP